MKNRKEMTLKVCIAALTESQILDIHQYSGHPNANSLLCKTILFIYIQGS